MHSALYTSTHFVTRIRELVSGQEQEFLNELRPLVMRQDVTLDLENTQRIDAAGLAALIALYRDARKSGHQFAITNPSPRVEEILRLVGLSSILVTRKTEEIAGFRPQLEQTAA
jgi:anti-anti-sigma factor